MERNFQALMRKTISLFFLLIISCAGSEIDQGFVLGENVSYDLSNPDKTIFLGLELDEISGLGWFDEGILTCVQDEEGIVYLFDLSEEKVIRRISFKQSGDYEGIERFHDHVYVVKSNGTIYRIPLNGGDKVDADEFKTPLKSDNNIEALGFDSDAGYLLLGSKGKGYIGKEKKGKSLFAYSPSDDHFSDEPVLRIKRKQINTWLEEAGKKSLKSGYGFSGVAQHPNTGNFYIISSEGKYMIIIDTEGNMISYYDLPRKHFKQPEGICFDPSGTMYISNEARGGTANIMIFQLKE